MDFGAEIFSYTIFYLLFDPLAYISSMLTKTTIGKADSLLN